MAASLPCTTCRPWSPSPRSCWRRPWPRKAPSLAMYLCRFPCSPRSQIEVPTRHEEVTVERVPVKGEASAAQIGDDEVVVPVTEEEVIVHKRPVVKEEVRIRKDVVEETEVVEEDVRREEVEVEDETERRGGGH